MWPYIVGGMLVGKLFGDSLLPGGQKQEQPTVGGPPNIDRLCPVDPHIPPEMKQGVQGCWARGTIEQLEEGAKHLALQFPIARASLLARAHDLAKAPAEKKAVEEKRATPAAAPAPVTRVLTKEEQFQEEARIALEAANGQQNGHTKPFVVPTTVIDTTGVPVKEAGHA